jgi:hypothetical protein
LRIGISRCHDRFHSEKELPREGKPTNHRKVALLLSKLNRAKTILLECIIIVHVCTLLVLAVGELWYVLKLR